MFTSYDFKSKLGLGGWVYIRPVFCIIAEITVKCTAGSNRDLTALLWLLNVSNIILKTQTKKSKFNVTKQFCGFNAPQYLMHQIFNAPKYLPLGKVVLLLTHDKWMFYVLQPLQNPVAGETVSPKWRPCGLVCGHCFIFDRHLWSWQKTHSIVKRG